MSKNSAAVISVKRKDKSARQGVISVSQKNIPRCKTKICALLKIMKVVLLSKKSCSIFQMEMGSKWDKKLTYTIYGHVQRHTPQPHELSAYLPAYR